MKSKKTPTPEMDTMIPLLIGIWRRLNKLSGPSEHLQTREFRGVVTSVQELQKGLESGNELVGQNYFENLNLLSGYLLYFWILHYQQGLALISELPTPPKRVLDLASGPGAFSLAALKHGATEVVALDKSQTALQVAGQVCGRSGYALTARVHNVLKFPFPVQGKFDLIIVGYALTELFPDHEKGWVEAQKKWIESVSQLLTPNGMILFVESSQPHLNLRLLALRDELVRTGTPIQAPCVWKGDCPALQKKNPCYAQRELEKPFLIREIQRAAHINLGSLKMSYLITRNKAAGWPELPDRPLYRVISPPMDTHGGVRFHLCGTDGKRDLSSHVKDIPKEARAFEFLKRGELISFEGMMSRQEHYEIILGSRIKIEAPLNKPLPMKNYDES